MLAPALHGIEELGVVFLRQVFTKKHEHAQGETSPGTCTLDERVE